MSNDEAIVGRRRMAGPPIELRRVPQWLVWRSVERFGRPTKVPFHPRTRRAADVRDPDARVTYSAAKRAVLAHGFAGVGFVFTLGDPYCGIDLDRALDANGNLLPWAAPIVRGLATYAEVSPSGGGVKLFCRASLPRDDADELVRHRSSGHGDAGDGMIEMYDADRFFTVTGRTLRGLHDVCIEDRQAEVETLHRGLFAAKPTPAVARNLPPINATDEQILARAFAATNGAKFARLWAGDASDYAGDESARDAALCACLSFYTRDEHQIERLVSRSGCARDKWNDRPDYRLRTIRFVLSAKLA